MNAADDGHRSLHPGDALMAREAMTAVASPTLVDAARGYAAAAIASATRKAYRSDVATFAAWCAERGAVALPAEPDTVALYLTALAQLGRRASTITRASSSIAAAHAAAGLASPTAAAVVRAVLKGIRREFGVAPHQKAPLLAGELRDFVRAHLGEGPRDVRDRALLLVGFAGGMRRGELVALDTADVRFVDEGLELLIRRSKTDQEGAGAKIGIPYSSAPDVCPIRAVREWLEVLGAGTRGPLFRGVDRHGHVAERRLSAIGVSRAVKRLAVRAGKDPQALGAHSLRAGFVTSAARAGKSERDIMRQTRHRSVVTVRGYIRDAELFHDNAAAGLL